MENEKTADEREAMQEALEKLEETETQMSLDEFKETWGAVEVDGQAEVSQDVAGTRRN